MIMSDHIDGKHALKGSAFAKNKAFLKFILQNDKTTQLKPRDAHPESQPTIDP